MRVTLRKFEEKDISNKVKWINDPKNNIFLHYDLPLEVEKTRAWFEKNKNKSERFDAVIEVDGVPVGLIGLLAIDKKNKKAEYYITMGEQTYKGKGIAFCATRKLLNYAFCKLRLQKIYLFTEIANFSAQHLFEKAGFVKEGNVCADLFYEGRWVNRYLYGITKQDYLKQEGLTPIQFLDTINENQIYIKRDDLIPYSFGGNKARKAALFFEEYDMGDYDYIVTYGSSHSNHCRVVANMAAQRKVPCLIISSEAVCEQTYNSQLMTILGAEIITVPTEHVKTTIDCKLQELSAKGYHPYFIPGGGHGNLGTQAYVNCYDEIVAYETEKNVKFDYIFFATGTGTTQAGLVCGQILENDLDKKIVGISIARDKNRGGRIVVDSINEFFKSLSEEKSEQIINDSTLFIDDYIGSGYGKDNTDVINTITNAFLKYGIPMDSTYTGKAFDGMKKYIINENITNKNILFIHTGGTPLFFDDVRRMENEI